MSIEQVVEVVAPLDVLQEVLHAAVEHQPPPHERGRLVLDEEAHRDDCAGARRRSAARGGSSPCGRRARSPARRPSTPSMRGTEKPQTSASSTPTVRPRAARAAARLTVTEDLPTPPLPDATRMTLVVGPTAVSSGALGDVEAGLGHGRGLLLGGHLGPSSVTPVTPRAARRCGCGCRVWIWARSGQPAVVRAMVTVTCPASSARDRADHAEIDDVAAQLGVDDPAQQGLDLVDVDRVRPDGRSRRGVRRRDPRAESTGGPGEPSCRRQRRPGGPGGSLAAWPLPWIHLRADRRTRRPSRAAGRPEGAGRQHPLRHLPRAGPVAAAPGHRRRGRRARPAPQHRRPHLERMRDVGLLQVQSDVAGRRRPTAAPLLPGRRRPVARASSRLVPHPGPHAPAARRRHRGRRRRRGRRRAATRAGSTASGCRAGAAWRRSAPSSTPWASTRRSRSTRTRATRRCIATIAFAHCPFRDLAEQRPDLLCSLHRGLIEGVVQEVGGGEVVGFGSLVDRSPCQVRDPPRRAARPWSTPRREPVPRTVGRGGCSAATGHVPVGCA